MPRPRGRPRGFDPEEVVETAQHLFHARAYDAVAVSEVTEALGIKPPSFYAAFGSKAALYGRVLARWIATEAIPLAEILRPDRPVAEALAAVLADAARRYASDPDRGDGAAAGCLVLEGTRDSNREAREAALAFHVAAEEFIHDYIAARHPAEASRITDYLTTTMSGLSAKARCGHGPDPLLATAQLAAAVIAQALEG